MEDLFDVSRGPDRHRADAAAGDAPPRRGAVRDGRVLRDDTRRGAATRPAAAGVVRPGARDRHRDAVHQPRSAGGPVPRHGRSARAPCSAGSSSRRSASPRRWPSRRIRYHRIRFPDTASYPGALLNSTATAFIDEVTFRGAIFGTLIALGLEANASNVIQTLLYALATRLGAPGRDRYLLATTIGIGLIGGWLTAVTGGIAAAFLGHAVTRFAIFLCTGHTGQTLPRGREVEEIEKRRRPPDGWRVIGNRESASRDR